MKVGGKVFGALAMGMGLFRYVNDRDVALGHFICRLKRACEYVKKHGE